MSELYYVPGWILGKIQLFTNNLVYSKSTDCYRLAWQQTADNSLSSIINLYRLILRFQGKKKQKKQRMFNNTGKDSNKRQKS